MAELAAPTLTQLLIVGTGGFIGSALRFLVSGWVYRALPFAGLPWGTLAVNIAGCLAIGLLGGAAESRQLLGPEMRLFLMLGVLGGFTTFSTFGYETLGLLSDGENFYAAAYVCLHVGAGIAAAWLGYRMGSLS